jgi:AAA domain-containing protein
MVQGVSSDIALDGLLYPRSLCNLMSARDREILIATIERRIDRVIELSRKHGDRQQLGPRMKAAVRPFVEEAAHGIQMHLLQGAPSEIARVVANGERPHAPIDRLVPPKRITTVAGAGGDGKSMFLLGVAVHGALGISLPGGCTIARPLQVLYIDAEDEKEEFDHRFGLYMAGLSRPEAELPALRYLPLGRPLADDITRVRREMLVHAADLAILDSQQFMLGGGRDPGSELTRFFLAVRSLIVRGATVLMATHVNREDVKRKHEQPGLPIGRVETLNRSRLVWGLSNDWGAGKRRWST